MKLVKKEDNYYLVIPGESTNEFIASIDGLYVKHKLSLKNCEAIENGYDLDELAEKATNKQLIRILSDEDKEEVLDDIQKRKFYFIEGAKAILEILGDKKFSEKELKFNMLQLFYLEKNEGEEEAIFRERQLSFIEKSIQSLQKNEWDVEIVMEVINHGKGEDGKLIETVEPKLDANGCLILKRK